MRRAWLVAALLLGLAGAAAWEVRPGKWAAEQLATQVAGQMAAGNVTALVREATPELAALMGDHLEAAIAPLQGAHVRQVRLISCTGSSAVATVQYTDGQTAQVSLANAGGTRWLVAGLT